MLTDRELEAYLERVGLPAAPRPTPDGLAELHLAHATHVPFENLDVLLGRTIRLDLEGLQSKLVRDRRGGYCYEQNLLLATVLETLGFTVTRLAARVRYRATRTLPRTHALLRVETDDGPWIADVGFGGSGQLLPLRLVAGHEQRQFLWTYRLIEGPGGWVLQAQQDGTWRDFHAFTLEPQEVVDFEVASHYVSTHPDSPFTRTLVAQLPTPESRCMLRNLDLTIESAGGTEARACALAELPGILSRHFGLTLPPELEVADRPWTWGS